MTVRSGKIHDMHRCVVYLNGSQLRCVDHLKGWFGQTRGEVLAYFITDKLREVSGTPLLPSDTVHALAAKSRASCARRKRRAKR